MAVANIEIDNLINHINKIDRISNKTWLKLLNKRKLDELTFHDRDRNRNFIDESKTNDNYERFYGNRKYYSTIKRSNDFVEKWIQNEAVGKIFLDYACGNGNQALLAAKNGAALSIGLDISKVSVKNALVAAKNKNIKINQKGGVCFFQADAENTKLPDCCIDTIICSGMLHHLDLSYAFPELRRILKPGGKILAVEALDYNPAIKLYRMLTPSMRTDWEKAHILSLRDIRFAKRFFYVEKIHYWHITAYIGGKFPFLFPVFDFIDKIFENIPYLQRMAWIFTFVLRKK